MKTFLCTAALLSLACAQGARAGAIDVPPGPLSDAVEALARQTGVDVIYPGRLLDGLSTAGVSGSLEPQPAFRRLLEGSALALSEDHGAFLISPAAPMPRAAAADASKSDRRIAPDTLSNSPAPGAICHRVSQDNRTRVYCGQPDQWAQLQARSGFRCKNEGSKRELCASAQEWKRLEVLEQQRSMPFSGLFRSQDNGVAEAAAHNPSQSVYSTNPPMAYPTPPKAR